MRGTIKDRRKKSMSDVYADILCVILAVALTAGLVYILVEHSLPIMGYK